MMKKLSVLILVLGLATTASAVPSLVGVPTEVADGTSATITITSGDADPYGALINMESAAAALGNLAIFPAAGPDASILDPVQLDVPGFWLFEAVSFNVADPVVAGDHFTFDYTALDGSSVVTLTLFDFDLNVISSHQIQNTPEPMTLGLLGLGGLFLRRRK
jgi:hypothetical protein